MNPSSRSVEIRSSRLRFVRVPFAMMLAVAIVVPALFASRPIAAAPPTSVDLFRYVRVGRFNLPEPTGTPAPANSKLALEASAVTYNWDTQTLFVVGDGGTSIVQVTKQGEFIDSMTLAPGTSAAGTDFYDTEGLTYVGDGKFVLIEERDRQVNLFTYVAGGVLHRADAQTVKLGTTIGNIGLEGLSYDPSGTSGFILVKEKDPQSIFRTLIDFAAGTATNGGPAVTSSTNLFSPPLANLADFSDVFALSNIPSLSGQPDFDNLLLLSQESGQILNISRTGVVNSRLTIVRDPGSPLNVADMTMEGITMDRDGILYVVNENGGGSTNQPQLWVYAHTDATNLVPSAVALENAVTSIPDNTSTAAPVKLADIVITDDGIGNNVLSLGGADAASFQIIGTGLFLKSGTALNNASKPSYTVTVSLNDPEVGGPVDATVDYTLQISAAVGGTAALIISEVASWSSGNSTLLSDWIEITNIGSAPQTITGWKIDDDSNQFATAITLNDITSIAPGESVIFIEVATNPAVTQAIIDGKKDLFRTLWFGGNAPQNLQIGYYSGGGIGLGTGGDQVNLFSAAGAKQTGVNFGNATTASPLKTFDNAAGLTNNGAIALLSASGVNGAFSITDGSSTAIGSPGTIGPIPTPVVTITATDDTAAETPGSTGTFRISRTGSQVGPLNVNFAISGSASASDYTPALIAVATIPAGQSFVDIVIAPEDDNVFETPETLTLTLGDTGSSDVGDPSVATITIADNDPPNTFIGSHPSTPTTATAASFAFSGSDPQEAISGFECSLDVAAFAACTSPVQFTGLGEGTHTFRVRALGNTGGADPTPASFTWVVDLTPPAITVGTNMRAPWLNGKIVPVTISGTVTDALAGVNPSSVTYSVTDEVGQVQPTGPITLGAGGQYSLTIQLEANRRSQDRDGRQYQIIVSATDNAGNQTSNSTSVSIPKDQPLFELLIRLVVLLQHLVQSFLR